MENAKHIGCMCAMAVALGVGMAVANTPAVALAAPADSGAGSSRDSGPTSSGKPSAKSASSETNDAPSRHRANGSAATTAALTPSISTPSISTSSTGTHGGATPAKTKPNPAVVTAAGAGPAAPHGSLDLTRPVAALVAAPTPATAAAPVALPPPASMVNTPTPADPVSRVVSTLINAAMSPFANSAPTTPVQPPAALAMLAFARREFEPGFSNPSTTVSTPAATTSAVDPDFITSTHNFGLFSITSAADPNDNHFVAFAITSPIFTDILTSGADPEGSLGLGAASTGVAGHTVNTFVSPLLNFSIDIPVTDPFAELFTALVALGF
jgi:hypothetical protein